MNILHLDAETLSHALGGMRTGACRYKAPCPAHDDKNPSFSITQASDKVLLHCWSGCSQAEVIAALQSRGLWPKKNNIKQVFPTKQEMRAFCYAYEADCARDIPASTKERNRYRHYQNILCKPFSPAEVAELDAFCRIYSSAVRRGETPTTEENETFRRYSRAMLRLRGAL